METERNRSCKTGFNKSSTVDSWWSCICSGTKRLLFQIKQKEKRAALKSALTSRVNESKFIVVDELKLDSIKTKNFVQVLNNLKVEKALVVLNDMDTNVIKSASNVPTVKTAQTNELNVFDVLKYDTVVVTKDAVKTIEEVYA